MEDQPTCGTGLAGTAPLPAALAELTSAMADVLEAHLPALDSDDDAAKQERDAYTALVTAHRQVASNLHAVAFQMADNRDLPVAPHNEQALLNTQNLEAFRTFVEHEQELAKLLATRLEADRAMLAEMSQMIGHA